MKRNISDCEAVAHMHVDIKSHSGASAFSAPYVCKLSKKGEERMCFFTKWMWSYWGIIWKQVDALLVNYSDLPSSILWN